ncbi:MAG TPA: adenylyltransferase/cytidyltransferase family protein [Candidatus Sulfotelmatobacter sp.]|jgi:nicotinamide-nucleotide adenylyltransferase|nr:adenylyltransferase/cytidyltransferase family protein [Candidatus Sulfotelmatobacter sp.]
MSEPRRERDNSDNFLMELVTSGQLDWTTQPITSKREEHSQISQFEAKTVDRYNTALVIGRFQPLHRGHIHLINHALAISSNIIIGIGSANVRNRDNPFSAEHREQMLNRALGEERILSRVCKLVRINDYEDDDMWFREMLNRTGRDIDVVVGNNGWVNDIFEKEGYKTLEIPLFKRAMLSGTTIREKHLYPNGIIPQL